MDEYKLVNNLIDLPKKRKKRFDDLEIKIDLCRVGKWIVKSLLCFSILL